MIGLIAVAYTVYMWVQKDIVNISGILPKEQVLPMVLTSVAVSLVKVLAMAGVILLVRWIAGKMGDKNKDK